VKKEHIKVAIVYHYLAHYRLPIFQELMRNKDVEYTIYSGNKSDIEIKKVDVHYSTLAINNGGLRWIELENKWFLNNKILYQSGLIKTVFSGKYDAYIFLGNPFHISTWIASIIARIKGNNVYYWMHGFYRNTIRPVDYLKLFLFYKIPTGFLLYGNRSLEMLRKHKIKRDENMRVIYNSLNYEESSRVRKVPTQEEVIRFRRKFFKYDQLPTVVFVGRLNGVKKIDYLLTALKQLLIKKSNIFNLLLIGDGEENESLKSLSSKLELSDYVHFYGACYDEDINGYLLMHSDLCVTPGEVGLTAIHSLSYGTPIISHNNMEIQMPEVEAIIPGVTGDLYEYQSLENLVNRIEHWFHLYPVKSESISHDCFAIIDEYYNPKFQASVINKLFSNS
jgi:glycosyltransferase involved in cell wall biosynthesis